MQLCGIITGFNWGMASSSASLGTAGADILSLSVSDGGTLGSLIVTPPSSLTVIFALGQGSLIVSFQKEYNVLCLKAAGEFIELIYLYVCVCE